MNIKCLKTAGLAVATFAVFGAAAPTVQANAGMQIQLFHRLPESKAAALKELVDRFNAQEKNAKVVLSDVDWRNASPHMLILEGEDEEAFVAGKPRYKALHVLMKDAGVALQTLRPPAMMTRTPVNAKGQLLALPVGLSTPVLFLNRDALRRAGVNPETAQVATWFELQETLGRLADTGHSCPYTVAEPGRVMVENLSAWHNQPVAKSQGKGKAATMAPSFNGMFQVKHVAMMASWSRARYLHVFEHNSEAEQRFASGDCAVIAAPSSSWADFRRQGKVDVAVSRLPYHEDFPGAPQNTVADGPALWASAGKKPAEYKAVARFIAFWLQPQNQVAWQRETGYLPLNRAGLLASSSELLGDDLDNVRVAVEQLTNKPTTTESGAQPVVERERVRRILDEELAGVWADRTAAKEALDNAVARAAAAR
ncbi:extracellular solute-binding protein [Thauera linaloolentis]|uniref:sn-glycerol-3-phosphate-binding periplasmic protein UgpB n=1 Tax=Thauera linaloolentis (strain DSM 12138 / JCM 21573 / CCUG 41526 / CIP 105981 / IAM 15112 / NBRC 102519 / 47Lol) TaxID=1123367 RepID=N6Y6J4_THAL4|nr:extracellular solute-binding protein [Thauera linaloolentis]ENO89816.1 family 1 extracellular solute-binding protein [Thauera linaloolentis 47Lol = DSM 12138]MCM8566995.1 extracellular solute-binding protein [Thauera linaloolentis]